MNVSQYMSLNQERRASALEKTRWGSGEKNSRPRMDDGEQYVRGLQEGIDIGIREGIDMGLARGIEKGMEKGMEKGLEKGIRKGAAEMAWAVSRKLQERGFDPEMIREIVEEA